MFWPRFGRPRPFPVHLKFGGGGTLQIESLELVGYVQNQADRPVGRSPSRVGRQGAEKYWPALEGGFACKHASFKTRNFGKLEGLGQRKRGTER